MSKSKKKRGPGGSKPRIADVAATARVELLVPPDVKERWQAAAAAAGLSVGELVRTAVDVMLADKPRGELADLGRRVVELVAELRHGGRS